MCFDGSKFFPLTVHSTETRRKNQKKKKKNKYSFHKQLGLHLATNYSWCLLKHKKNLVDLFPMKVYPLT